MDSEEAQSLEIVFAEEDPSGATIPLLPNGDKKRVTDQNKTKYIVLLSQYYLVSRVKPLLDAMRDGFSDVHSRRVMNILNADKMQQLLCGESVIDVENLIRFVCVFYTHSSVTPGFLFHYSCYYSLSPSPIN